MNRRDGSSIQCCFLVLLQAVAMPLLILFLILILLQTVEQDIQQYGGDCRQHNAALQ